MLKVYRRKDKSGKPHGNYYCRIKVGNVDTDRSLRTQNPKIAEKRAKDLFNSIEEEQYSPSAPTLSEASDRMYMEVWSQNRDDVAPVKKIRRIIDIIGNIKLNELTPNHISLIEGELLSNDAKPATINRYKAALLTILLRARDVWGVINTFPKIKKVKEKNQRDRLISKNEEKEIIRILANVKKEDMRFESSLKRYRDVADIVQLLVETGMRLGELLSLTKKEINMEVGIIDLTGDICKSKEGRVIPMSAKVRQILERKLTERYPGCLYPYTPNQVFRIFQWAKGKAKIRDEKLVLHSLRHTFASRVLQKGAHLKQVKELLGHADLKTTERYAKYELKDLKKAIQLLD